MNFERRKVLEQLNQIGSALRTRFLDIRRSNAKRNPINIAIDGGAFQQGIAAGIYNVAAGLINSITERRPDISFTLITDPQFGGCNEELLSGLSIRPELLELPLEASESKGFSRYYSQDPAIMFEADGVLHIPIRRENEYIYRGPSPIQTFHIISRADRPKYTGAGADPRKLGVSLARIEVRSSSTHASLSLDDSRLASGFYPPEGSWRWTDGRAALPITLFSSDEVEVLIEVAGTTRYRLREVVSQATDLHSAHPVGADITTELEEFENILLNRGINFYLVNHFIPLCLDKVHTLAINYDAIPALFPEHFTVDAIDNFAMNIQAFKHASHIFSISETSRNDLLRIIGKRPNDVTSVLIDIDPSFERANVTEVSRVRLENALSSAPYMICVGTLEPRKNHKRLIEAYSSIAQTGMCRCNLIVVGKQGWGADDLRELVAAHKLSEHVYFLDNISNADLRALYSGALFSIYPSLYEGFGLPILEAMACGCPVVTSNVSSMPEVAGDAAYYIDPASIESIRSAIHQMLNDADLRNALAQKGLSRRSAFSWNSTAARVLDVLDRF